MKSAGRYLAFFLLQKQNGGVHLAWKGVVGGNHPGLQGVWNIKINFHSFLFRAIVYDWKSGPTTCTGICF